MSSASATSAVTSNESRKSCAVDWRAVSGFSNESGLRGIRFWGRQ